MLHYVLGFKGENEYCIHAMNYQGHFFDENGKGFDRISRITLPEVYNDVEEVKQKCKEYNDDLNIVQQIIINTIGETVFTKA